LPKTSTRLSPRDPQIGLFYSRIGCAHLLELRTDEAILWCERARNATPAHPQFRTFLASAYALKGDTERAAAELAEARRLVGDDRYASIARLRAAEPWGVPKNRALVETTYFVGLRKAGVPEADREAAGIGRGAGPSEGQGGGSASLPHDTQAAGKVSS
jgi:hypothetical protein